MDGGKEDKTEEKTAHCILLIWPVIGAFVRHLENVAMTLGI
jgi:hypothetical protein